LCEKWASECDVAFAKTPICCYIAVKDKDILGFAVYDTTCKGFFGPTGVSEKNRGLGLGKAILIYSLEGLKQLGYGMP